MVIIASSLYENIDVKIRKFIKENLILELVAFNFLVIWKQSKLKEARSRSGDNPDYFSWKRLR